MQGKMVMQGLSFISGRAAVICYLGERGSGGYLVIKTALEIHREAATMEKKAARLCVRERERVWIHTVKVR